jgi:hypothetical protein
VGALLATLPFFPDVLDKLRVEQEKVGDSPFREGSFLVGARPCCCLAAVLLCHKSSPFSSSPFLGGARLHCGFKPKLVGRDTVGQSGMHVQGTQTAQPAVAAAQQ